VRATGGLLTGPWPLVACFCCEGRCAVGLALAWRVNPCLCTAGRFDSGAAKVVLLIATAPASHGSCQLPVSTHVHGPLIWNA
jgi:hypothetical protein